MSTIQISSTENDPVERNSSKRVHSPPWRRSSPSAWQRLERLLRRSLRRRSRTSSSSWAMTSAGSTSAPITGA